MFQDKESIEEVLHAFAEHLAEDGVHHLELVVCGGAALNILGLIHRGTRDVDVVAIVERDKHGQAILQIPSALDESIKKAILRIHKDFNLEENWFNIQTGALFTSLHFPKGILERTIKREFGNNVIIHFLDRYDQIHFKLYAALDNETRRAVHLSDLLALSPSETEICEAAKWLLTRPSGEFYKHALQNLLEQIGFGHVAKKL